MKTQLYGILGQHHSNVIEQIAVMVENISQMAVPILADNLKLRDEITRLKEELAKFTEFEKVSGTSQIENELSVTDSTKK